MPNDSFSMIKSLDVNVRPAKFEDYEAIMAINRTVYDGADYLSHRYWEYMQDPAANCFVAEVDGKVVAFIINYIMDSWTTILSMTGRVDPVYQGRHIMDKLRKESISMVKEKFPLVKNSTSSRTHVLTYEKFISNPRTRHWITQKRNIAGYGITLEQMKRAPEIVFKDSYAKGTVRKIGYEESVRFLSQVDGCKSLFPDPVFLAQYPGIPYKVCRENLVAVALTDTVFISKCRRSISFGYVTMCAEGVAYIMAYYGSDIDMFLEHAHCHVHHLLSILSPDISRIFFLMEYPPDIDHDLVKGHFGPCFGQPNVFTSGVFFALQQPLSYVTSKL